MLKSLRRRLAVSLAAALILTGCSSSTPEDITTLTIMTTPAALDQATSLAVAEYVEDRGTAVEVQQHEHPLAVYEALETETAPDHAVIGVVTAHQDQAAEEATISVPDSVDMVSQAPAELGLVAVASPITAVKFSQAQTADAEQHPLAEACADHTWFHTNTAEDQLAHIATALRTDGCEPAFESTGPLDADSYDELIDRVNVEPGTVAMLYGLEPVISDQGLTTLDVDTDQWPHSNVIAVSPAGEDAAMADQVQAVLDVLDSAAATELLREYHNAQTSVSDLEYEVDDAMRYWLHGHGLVDDDTVAETSTNDQ